MKFKNFILEQGHFVNFWNFNEELFILEPLETAHSSEIFNFFFINFTMCS